MLIESYKSGEALRQVDPELELHSSRNLSERAADWLTNKIGTWRFVIGGFSFMAVYATLNAGASFLGLKAWDEYPYVFLNLILSTASGFAVPILLISQNRQATIDRSTARVSQRMILSLAKEIQQMRADANHPLSEERLREIIREEIEKASQANKS